MLAYYASGGRGDRASVLAFLGQRDFMGEFFSGIDDVGLGGGGGGTGLIANTQGNIKALQSYFNTFGFTSSSINNLFVNKGRLSWWSNLSVDSGTLTNHVLNLESGASGLFNRASNLFSNIWNSSMARAVVSDSYTVGLSSNVTAFLGVGTTPINFTFLTRGKEPGLYFTPTVNAAIGDGIEANVGVTFGRGLYTRNPRNITPQMLQGHTFGASGGLGFIVDGSVGASYAPVNISDPFGNEGGFINVSGQLGPSIQGSPVSVINLQGNYQYTPIVKPIFKF